MFASFALVPIRAFPNSLRRLSTAMCKARASGSGVKVVTWDIDGTLLLGKGPGGNSAHKLAIEEGVQKVFGLDVKVNDVPHAGSTDRAIIRDMLLHCGLSVEVTGEKIDEVIAVADEAIVRFVAADGDEAMQNLILPGVSAALDALRDLGVVSALTTGNLESCAWAKLKAAGLDGHFKTGGFGSDCLDRSDILRVALDRVSRLDNAPKLEKDESGKILNAAHVGDSIADMKAAREAGTLGVGVLTGAFSRDQLEKEAPTVVFDDLADTSAFLKAVGLKPTE